jgi:hypothetical protein
MLHTLQGLLLAISLGAVAAGLWMRDRLPPPSAILQAVHEAPLQTPIEAAPFAVSAGGVDYRVQPLHRYELRGLVVSRHDTSAWWDVVHRDWWNDHLNVADLCLVWGTNLSSGVYRALRFWNGTFTCTAGSADAQAWARFEPNALSNNHLLAADPVLVRRLRAIRPGDQVVVRGMLAEYAHDAGLAFRRGTSTRRDDRGDGACETIWVTEVQVVRRANAFWRSLLPLAWFGVLLSVIAWFLLPPPPVE